MADEVAGTNTNTIAGLEISRKYVRAVLLNRTTEKVERIAQGRIAPTHKVSQSAFLELCEAIEFTWGSLEAPKRTHVGVSFGTLHSGVGSGPTINQWITSLEQKVDKRIMKAGSPDTGVSYAPIRSITEIDLIFESLEAELKLVELAPISITRVLGPGANCSVIMDSSVGWRTRIHEGNVLEALAYPEGLSVGEVTVEDLGGEGRAIANRSGIAVPTDLMLKHKLVFSDLALSIGAALGVGDTKATETNLLDRVEVDLTKTAEQEAFTLPAKTTQKLVAVSSTVTVDRLIPPSSDDQAANSATNWPETGEVMAVDLSNAVPPTTATNNAAATSPLFFDQATFVRSEGDNFIDHPKDNWVKQLPPMPSQDSLINQRMDEPDFLRGAPPRPPKEHLINPRKGRARRWMLLLTALVALVAASAIGLAVFQTLT